MGQRSISVHQERKQLYRKNGGYVKTFLGVLTTNYVKHQFHSNLTQVCSRSF
jgi:hypothetical protein